MLKLEVSHRLNFNLKANSARPIVRLFGKANSLPRRELRLANDRTAHQLTLGFIFLSN
jgi:hypothetical protein